ncbi:BQ2448_303 [Microbotryum intermedium]|uniref:BQ2448_303 protein n=1 Tax=Microbotryum intermedium TaxID=269621 RepID=A0A238F230_9BASI|nr:BQ2448_303 [Microbotryum intermedium]
MVSYKFIEPSELAQLYHSGLEAGRDFQVVDVRDEDRIGGHLPGSMRAPSEQRTLQYVEDLVAKLEGVPKVIFHCTLSQIRGPKAASLYCAALNARQGALQGGSTPSELTSKMPGDSIARPTRDSANTAAAQSFSPNPYESSKSASEEKGSQEVLLLRGGFGEWQRMYKNDPKLVEGFDASIWAEREYH